MLRYLNSGPRRYGKKPVFRYTRGAVEFQAVFSGTAGPDRGGLPDAYPPSPRLWVLGPDSEHGWSDRGDGVSEILVFHFYEVNPLLLRALGEEQVLTKALSASDIDFLRRLHREIQPHSRNPRGISLVWMDKVKAELTLLALSSLPPDALRDVDWSSQTRVDQAVSWYRERLAQAPAVADVARGLKISTVHLRRLFLQVHGRSPHAVFHEIRMSTALRWLREDTLRISEIADRLGFSEPSAFTRAFRDWHGSAPTNHRGRMDPDPLKTPT